MKKKSVTVVPLPPPKGMPVGEIPHGQAFMGKVGSGPYSLYIAAYDGAVLLEDASRVWPVVAPVVDYTPVNIKITVVE